MFCKYCGTQLNDDAKFCTACGKALVEEPAQAPTEPVYKAPAEPVYQAPAEPVYQAPAEPVYQAPAEPVYQAPAEPVYQAPQYQVAPAYEAPAEPAAAPAPAQSAGMFPLLSLIIGAVAATFGILSGLGVFPLVMALIGMIPAVIFGVLGLIRSIKGKDKKGIILSAVGLGLAFVAWVGAMTGLSMM